MKEKFLIKKANYHRITEEILSTGFDAGYAEPASEKYKNLTFKIFGLRAPEANILKQLCLSLGFDCAVSRDTITCKCEKTDCIINGSKAQYKKLIKKLMVQPFRLKELAKNIEEKIIFKLSPIKARNTLLDWKKPYIMGILNVTPDSFSDGGEHNTIEKAIQHAKKLIEEGCDILDIGGESTRPNALPVTNSEEINRVVPVIKAIREFDDNILISIDTTKYEVAKEAIKNGADIINDVSGLKNDNELKNYVCKNNIPTIIMHSKKIPADSSIKTEDSKTDIVEEIYSNLSLIVEELVENGLERKNIIVDPGIGFGKSINDSFEILKRIDEFSTLNCPILVGISRKSFISKSFDLTKDELDEATLVYDSFLLTKGVNIIRTHEVKKHAISRELLEKLL